MDGVKLDVIDNCGTIDGFLNGLLTTLVFDVLFVIDQVLVLTLRDILALILELQEESAWLHLE